MRRRRRFRNDSHPAKRRLLPQRRVVLSTTANPRVEAAEPIPPEALTARARVAPPSGAADADRPHLVAVAGRVDVDLSDGDDVIVTLRRATNLADEPADGPRSVWR